MEKSLIETFSIVRTCNVDVSTDVTSATITGAASSTSSNIEDRWVGGGVPISKSGSEEANVNENR